MAGFLIIFMGVFLGLLTGAFKRVPNQKIIDGNVVSLERHHSNTKSATYYAHVEYYINDKPYCIKTQYAASGFSIGQTVKVAYNSECPEEAFVVPSLSVYIIMLISEVFGVGVVVSTLF